LGGEEVCGTGKDRLMCIHTTFVSGGGKRKREKFQLSSSVPGRGRRLFTTLLFGNRIKQNDRLKVI